MGALGDRLHGEVYKFQELRRQLSELNHRFRSRTDTEVFLHAFMEWGLECMPLRRQVRDRRP